MTLAREMGTRCARVDAARDAVRGRRAVLLGHRGRGVADRVGRPHPIGTGERGPITKRLQEAFFALVKGETPDTHGWLTPVPQPAGAARPAWTRR